jgi:LytS/YehU family sensor histidine kinase
VVKDKEAAKLKSENLHTELKFLKSQINPHFLFNALNNIYAMSMMKSKDAPKMILKLSDILRYNLYDGIQDRVPIEKEMRYIENYVSFQKLKDENIRNIAVDFEGVDGNVMIAPLILIPFVENSFKHSKIEDVSKGWINIDLKTRDDKIIFKVTNSVPETEFKKDTSGGIGLENVKRRLELIYPQRYNLVLTEDGKQFSVTLTILL